MRSSWLVTWSVWHALFMREALARTMANRFAWFWMFAEPVAFVVIMIAVRELLGRVRFATGAEFIPWLIVGLTGFFLFREGVLRSIGAVDANQGLFAYRQVKPVDPVLVRNTLEGILKTLVLVILIVGASLLGHDILPADPLGAILAWASLWLLGMGGGLIVAVGATLVPEFGVVTKLTMLPMFLLSGAMIPLHALPHDIQQYLLYNPVLHAVECLRLSFFAGYRSLAGVNLMYVWCWALPMIALGLALHIRFAMRLKAK
ncbi:ABC transporter permease [Nitrococcus mobilis]|uniref:Transport permease protein n=1 Tax=Nitrococcus mobilis Nb-231 TaxID=314278 RepID=A4BRU5_9GAMM|nr:ABC transporter permease [Nitrococcus mobilis]EAR21666.1 ABC 2 transport system integral membrane protein [Nitrococcus mobilis Nb-231]